MDLKAVLFDYLQLINYFKGFVDILKVLLTVYL